MQAEFVQHSQELKLHLKGKILAFWKVKRVYP